MSVLCLRCGAPRTNATRCEYCGVLFDPSAAAPALPNDLPAEFHAAMKDDNLIEAIKIYRQTRNVGLKEARDEVLKLKMK